MSLGSGVGHMRAPAAPRRSDLTGLTQALAAEGKPHGNRVCVLYPRGMATHRGEAWAPEDRPAGHRPPPPATTVVPPEEVAALIV